ncbi:hypothetical protein MKW94_023921 [Papaver nudicaule]|uniref:Uncharacterized protein n=1 Tax=Papaver nudicaule TaxID=74823 RepID=A0AA41S7D8_PAPNU|nr:hypothetical protein [Papaver nudicaule]
MFFPQFLRLLCLILLLSQVSCVSQGREEDQPRPSPPAPGRPYGGTHPRGPRPLE